MYVVYTIRAILQTSAACGHGPEGADIIATERMQATKSAACIHSAKSFVNFQPTVFPDSLAIPGHALSMGALDNTGTAVSS